MVRKWFKNINLEQLLKFCRWNTLPKLVPAKIISLISVVLEQFGERHCNPCKIITVCMMSRISTIFLLYPYLSYKIPLLTILQHHNFIFRLLEYFQAMVIGYHWYAELNYQVYCNEYLGQEPNTNASILF